MIDPNVKLTPMLKQWLMAKQKAQDAIVLFRMGDFYELFGDDAVAAAPILELALTSRDKDKGEAAFPMAGFPHHSAPAYVAKLIAAGHKVAFCDQLEDPKSAKGIVKRDITRTLTPGTVIDDDALVGAHNNFLVSVVQIDSRLGCAALDWSTGAFVATSTDKVESICDEMARFRPAELLLYGQPELASQLNEALKGVGPCRIELMKHLPDQDRVGVVDDWFHEPKNVPGLLAAGLILDYLDLTQGGAFEHISAPRPYSADMHMVLDAVSLRHLHLVPAKNEVRKQSSLFGVLNSCKTAMGSRKLGSWLAAPSMDLAVIEGRHQVVTQLLAEPLIRQDLMRLLSYMYDLERITARASVGRVSPRDLGNLRDSLQQLAPLRALLLALGLPDAHELLSFDLLPDLTAHLGSALSDAPPLSVSDGGVFRRGFHADLDALSDLAAGARDEIVQIEANERARTGIPSLKVGYTRVFGYYIEVTKTHLQRVPEHYRRKQTIANGERFLTEELGYLEEKILKAQSQKEALESTLFEALRKSVAQNAPCLLATARCVAELDVLCAFAQTAHTERYQRPKMLPKEARVLKLEQARHPIAEVLARQKGDIFVANDVRLDAERNQIWLLTGPNMGGKSTFMRQVALIQIMAQAGSFVPAASAELSLCDRVFTRVGAGDDLQEGRSTFMVEMSETAQILKNATPDSLVLLDEMGRGTSTYDGLSLAQAVVEHLHEHTRARTLFATHYHELTHLAERFGRIANHHVAVAEGAGGISFLYLVRQGPAQKSYGIHVAKLAGLPKNVLTRAHEILMALEQAPHGQSDLKTAPQLSLFAQGAQNEAVVQAKKQLERAILALNINGMTPLEALNAIHALQNDVKQSQSESSA